MNTCFETGAIAIVTGLLGVMAGAVSLLFRELLKSKDSQIEELTRLARRSTEVGRQAISHAERER